MPKRATKRKSLHKSKKTFVLSNASISFLESEKNKRGRESASEVLEEIIHECRCKRNTNKIDSAISAYYDSISDEEREENKRWGEFAESQFTAE